MCSILTHYGISNIFKNLRKVILVYWCPGVPIGVVAGWIIEQAPSLNSSRALPTLCAEFLAVSTDLFAPLNTDTNIIIIIIIIIIIKKIR